MSIKRKDQAAIRRVRVLPHHQPSACVTVANGGGSDAAAHGD